jgi:hypothetical protein
VFLHGKKRLGRRDRTRWHLNKILIHLKKFTPPIIKKKRLIIKVYFNLVLITCILWLLAQEDDGVGRTCVCLHKTWDLTSLAMEVKEFQTTSCVAVWFLPWIQQNRCTLIEFMVWSHMHKKKNHGSWYGGGPIWCIVLKRKCVMLS